jgi:hypothetical protein
MDVIDRVDGLNIARSQNGFSNDELEHTIVQISSSTLPQFGSSPFVFDLKQKGVQYHDLSIVLTPSTISGLTGAAGNYPHFISAYNWISQMDIIVGGVTVSVSYGLEEWIKAQLFNTDEKRAQVNQSAGNYQSMAQLYTLSATSQPWIIPLKNIFTQTRFATLTQNHEIQFRITLKPITSCVNSTGCSGTPVATLSATLLARISYLDQNTMQQRLQFISKTPRHYKYMETKYQPININSGVNSATLILSSITGRCDTLFFVCRPTNALSGSSTTSFTQLSSYNLLNSSGTSLIGGQIVSDRVAQLALNKWWSLSSFSTEGYTGVNDSFVYMWSFSSDPSKTHHSGANQNYHVMHGNEQLILNFSSTLATAYTIDVFASCQCALAQTLNGVQKLTF